MYSNHTRKVHDRDHGLTVRYHNTTLQIKKNTRCLIQAKGHEGSNTTAQEHKVSGSNSIRVKTQEYRVRMLCIKKPSTKTQRSKRWALLPGNLQTTHGQRGTRRRRRHRGSSRCGGRHRESHAPRLQGSNVDCSGRSGKTIKGENRSVEYLAYPQVLCPLLS